MSTSSTFSRPIGPEEPAQGTCAFISVVVPIRNEERFIGHTLEQLVTQDYDPNRFEIIVVDGKSTDRTTEVVQEFVDRYPNVRLFENPKQWSSVARNMGVTEAEGELILIVDAHCELETDQYLRRLDEAFRRSGADCLGRPQPLDVSRATTVQRAIARARSSFLGHHPQSYIYSSVECAVPAHSVGVAYRREVFDRLGLFDEHFDACEDVEFNHRVDQAGLTCFITPLLRVRYYPRADLRGLLRQMFRYGRGRGRLLRKHRDTFTAMGFIPAAFVAGLISGPVLSWFFPPLGWIYLACLAIYVTMLDAVSLKVALTEKGGARLGPWLPLVFFTVHFGAGAGMLEELILGAFRHPPGAGEPVFYPRHEAAVR